MESKIPVRGGCLRRIRAISGSLKSAERRLADFILDAPDKTITLTLKGLEEASGASYATIVRFCKKAGYSGFKTFRRSLTADVLNQKEAATSLPPVDGRDSIETLIEKTFRNSQKTLEDTREFLDSRILEKAVSLMSEAKEIYFIGTGISGVCARYAFSRFFRIGIQCSAETDPTIYKIKTSLLQPGDILFAISSSGRSSDIVDAARLARKKEITVISLCDFAISPLTRSSTLTLYTTPRDTSFFVDMDVQLITGQITIIDVLLNCMIARMGPHAASLYRITKEVADREKTDK